jgi:hypothetical protein
MLRPKLTKTEQQKLKDGLKLPTIQEMKEEQVRTALIELWLWQAMRRHAIKLQHTPDNVVGAQGSSGIREWNGRFSRVVSKLLEGRGLKTWLKGDYANACEPTLRSVFGQGAGDSFFVQASKVALDSVLLGFFPCYPWEGGTADGTIHDSAEVRAAGCRDEGGAGPAERAGACQGARQRRRGVPAAGSRPDKLL